MASWNSFRDHAISEKVDKLLSNLHEEVKNTRSGDFEARGFPNSDVELQDEFLVALLAHTSKRLTTLRKARNSVLPIHRLSNELLDLIVEKAVLPETAEELEALSYTFLLNVAAVCSRWRTNILLHPKLWSIVDLGKRKMAPILFERSGNYPLHILLRSDFQFTEQTHQLGMLHADRWKSFSAYTPIIHQVDAWARWLRQPLPELRKLTFEYDDAEAINLPPLHNSLCLTHLSLRNVNPPLDSDLLSSIIYLKIGWLEDGDDDTTASALQALLQLLTKAPLLQFLSLEELVFHRPIKPLHHAVTLSNCTRLELRSLSSKTLEKFVPLIKLPQLHSLESHWDDLEGFHAENEDEGSAVTLDRALKATLQLEDHNGMWWVLMDRSSTIDIELDLDDEGSIRITAGGFNAWFSYATEWVRGGNLSYICRLVGPKELRLKLTSKNTLSNPHLEFEVLQKLPGISVLKLDTSNRIQRVLLRELVVKHSDPEGSLEEWLQPDLHTIHILDMNELWYNDVGWDCLSLLQLRQTGVARLQPLTIFKPDGKSLDITALSAEVGEAFETF